MRPPCSGIVFSLLLLAGSASAQNWPSFRGPNGSGVAEDDALPTSWDATSSENLAWKVSIPGFGHSSPVVWDDRICVTTAVSADAGAGFDPAATSGRVLGDDEAEQSWQVRCLDKGSGELLWTRTAREGVPRIRRHAKASHANATPVTDGERLVAFFGSEGLYAYDMEGELLWSRDLGVLDAGYVGLPEYQWGTASSPVIFEDLVIVQCDSRRDSFIAAYRLEDGEEAWITRRDELPSWSTPVIRKGSAGPELVTNSPRYFRGMDPRTGEELWRFLDDAEVKVPTPVVSDGLVFFLGGAPSGREFYALRPGKARGELSSEQVAWRVDRGGPYTPTPIVYGELLYVLTDNAVLRAYRTANGEMVYQTRVPETGGAYSASPIASNGLIYFASQDGDVHVGRAGESFELLSTNPMGEVLMATPAVSEGTLYLRGQENLFAVRERS